MKHITTAILFLVLTISCNKTENLRIEDMKRFADELLMSEEYKSNVIKTLPSIDNIQIALLEVPYREYPSIIILKYNEKSKKWIRTFECLSPGIQYNHSELFDWHDKGYGVDFMLNKINLYHFTDSTARIFTETTFEKHYGVVIIYQNFLHMHVSDSLSEKEFEPYTIDKTQYLDFANRLFDNKYREFETDKCFMFDTPKINDISFRKVNGTYEIHAITNNSQEWIYTFDGVDDKYRYLTNKKITVK